MRNLSDGQYRKHRGSRIQREIRKQAGETVHLQTASQNFLKQRIMAQKNGFARCDSLWQEMLDGTQDFSVIEMDYFYRGYRDSGEGRDGGAAGVRAGGVYHSFRAVSAGSRRGRGCLY